eukprot:CAMPEP_0181326666 /NCGR_PEP_ID=MMETSP1101-20121128/21643_1 /TAXON_ID=46948 /ORGANISM="Rhodomonas abbreviata, Strain Caron Lab Isolate" /LENGTH=71 /DNA_ID=CAMNT_0023435181 /DNA_START=57 /DNA_END=272 /DNA_ORIENTATION=+
MTSLASAPFEEPGSWSGASDDSAIGGADYGKPIDESIYSDIKTENCSRRRTHCDWTVVGPVAANGQRWSLK